MTRLSLTEYLKTLPLTVSEIITLPADASRRTFHRIITDKGPRMLMDAPPPHEDIRPYVHVAGLLQQQTLSAPEIFHQDPEHGYVVMEDLGDDTFTRVLKQTPNQEAVLYNSALSVLTHLSHQAPPQDLPPYDLDLLMRELALYPDWAVTFSPEQRKVWDEVWAETLEKTVLSSHHNVLVLRDYHVDNMIWLPQRQDVRQCGLLDFQDAVVGHPAYDLVSLLWDARRDVPNKARYLMTYLNDTGFEAGTFMPAYLVLGLQRTLKIIGIFHRLNRRDGKPHYLTHLPRLRHYVTFFLAQPACAPMAEGLGDVLRVPSPPAPEG
jgi:aminoglycoside/choline kinase family phosphotransferase